MELGLRSGVNIINDVSGLKNDANTINILKKYKSIILMHHNGNPKIMMKKKSKI